MDFTSGFPRETASSQETAPGSPAPFQGDPRNVTFLKHRTSNTSQSRPSESASIPRCPSLPRSKDPKWARENVTWILLASNRVMQARPKECCVLQVGNRRWKALCNKRLGQFLNAGLRPLHCCSKRAHGVDYTMVPSRFETGWLPVRSGHFRQGKSHSTWHLHILNLEIPEINLSWKNWSHHNSSMLAPYGT